MHACFGEYRTPIRTKTEFSARKSSSPNNDCIPQRLRLQLRPVCLSIQSSTFIPIRFRELIADLVGVPILIRIVRSILPYDFDLWALVVLPSVNEPLNNTDYNDNKECYYAII